MRSPTSKVARLERSETMDDSASLYRLAFPARHPRGVGAISVAAGTAIDGVDAVGAFLSFAAAPLPAAPSAWTRTTRLP